ncbi:MULTISPECIES: hypothetical protein [unclassified Mesorhizobium]|nr:MULTISPECIES: hypothetical protein [unclassified Mesorhizobium]MDG4853252.1 hypothetical protein [Mesorhizobium sp. WSM4982]MDG4899406.1 hypothetical protein [Mesorhizobium sp. WSM4962]MDG4913220.1 hypothetical protein [Mesorhizobium sp. WSM4983]MDG4918357.1 hypothetical protein [Mesorhizobium sp. WSM4989]RUV99496.1 hypothetical protein EOA49_19615 [Mesorhizobium sp. M1A.F.Ca.IN.020.04.1.1]
MMLYFSRGHGARRKPSKCLASWGRDKRLGIDYMSRMIHLTASFWYFSYGSSLAAGGLRSI